MNSKTNKGLAFKSNQYRYNHLTKNSYVSGFLELYNKNPSDKGVERPGIQLSNWRCI